MTGHLFVVHGDVAQLSADVLVYSTNQYGKSGHLYESFRRHVPGFDAAYAQGRTDAGLSDGRRLFAGKTFWLSLPHEEDGSGSRSLRGIVVVGVIGGGLSWEALNRKIVTAAIDMAAHHLGPPPNGRRWLVAIPGLSMGAALTSQAAWRRRAEAARAQIEAAREALTARDDLDVAFVAYTPDIYHLYDSARHAAAGGLEPTGGPAVPAGLAQAIRDSECVLFVGSGLSAGSGMPSWQKLIAKLAAELDLPPASQKDTTDYYLDVAQLYRNRHRDEPERLAEVIRAEFGGTQAKPTLAHYLLMALGVRHVITTNYGTLLEQALTALRRDPVKIVHEEDVARTGETGAHFVVKFHGDANGPGDALVLSRSDYEDFFHRHPAMTALLEGLLLNQTFLFVGYSLSDPNFRQIYSRIARILSAGDPKTSKRMAYAIQFDADASGLTREVWKSRKLQLLDVPGTGEEQGHNFLRFLDGLASATLDEPKMLVSAPEGMREILVRLGKEVKAAASRDDLGAEEVRQLASTLAFLTRHGWRPSVQDSAWEIWHQLAQQAGDDPGRKRMMLREALKHTENLKDAETVREEIRRTDDVGK